jgi:hypothetical protein
MTSWFLLFSEKYEEGSITVLTALDEQVVPLLLRRVWRRIPSLFSLPQGMSCCFPHLL